MFTFRKKRKTRVFGANIEPTCELCRFNGGKDKPFCVKGRDCNKVCRKYVYDPLKREPDTSPKLLEYTEDDFSL